jgi:hypothetical protein
VTFDEDDSVINATVIVTRGDAPGTFRHHVPAISAAGPNGSNVTVIWTLSPGDGLSVDFVNEGIIIPKPGLAMPDGIDDVSIPLALSATKRQVTFTNNVSDVNVIRYDFDLEVNDAGHPLVRADLVFDPTIAVVKEPVEG